jgi:SAM-dependent methyltransferase
MINEQATIWNGPAGHTWVALQEVLDRMFKPLEVLLAEEAKAGANFLDIGCGTGAITLAVARNVGSTGHATGVDISEPMINAARTRAEREKVPATFIVSNAESYAFAPAVFDQIVSRFGVMFFDDPVAAFRNIRNASKPGARACLLAWRTADENPFMTTAERASSSLLPNVPPRDLNGPGQFAFGDAARVRGILATSGWSAIDIQPLDVECTFAEKDLISYFTRLGPLGRILGELDEATQRTVITAVRNAFAPFVQGDTVSFNAACWTIRASA